MRRKRRILSHVFYISGGDTVPGNLNTLEYLMYVTARTNVPDRKRQAAILEALLTSGLYYMTLVSMKLLTAAERATICLLSAAMSSALLVVFSVADLTFTPQLAEGVRFIAEMIESRGGRFGDRHKRLRFGADGVHARSVFSQWRVQGKRKNRNS